MAKSPRGLSFTEAGHVYTYRGAQIMSVTQHLNACGFSTVGDIPPGRLLYALERGRLVHRACELWDEGRLDLDTLDPALKPYVEAWMWLAEELDAVPAGVEERVLGEHGRWAGTLDWRGSIRGCPRVIIDRKCGDAVNPTKPGDPLAGARFQLAGYQIPVEETTGEPWRRAIALLRPNGKPKLIPIPESGWANEELNRITDDYDRAVFRSIVSVNEARQRWLKRTGLEGLYDGDDE